MGLGLLLLTTVPLGHGLHACSLLLLLLRPLVLLLGLVLLRLCLLLGRHVLRQLDEVVQVRHVLHERLHVACTAERIGNHRIQVHGLGLPLALTTLPLASHFNFLKVIN